MKILLIAPSSREKKWKRVHNSLGMNLHPKYGLLLLGSYAVDLGHEIRYLDESFEDIQFDEQFDIVGITCTTNKANRAYEIADNYQKLKIPVVMGGVHPTVFPNEAKKHADSVVIGEADYTWPILLKDLENKRLRPFYSTDNPFDLSQLPKIRYELIPPNTKYRHPGAIETTRGCPNYCEFCSTHFFGKKYRIRPINDIIENISYLPEDYIIFMDDNLVGDKNNATKLFRAMRGMVKAWTGHATLDIANYPKLLKAMAESGCRNLDIGLDTLSLKNLKKIGKRVNYGINYEDAVKKIHDHGIDIIAGFILGFDYDTENSFEEIYNFVIRNKIFLPTFWILTPYPGTALYKRFKIEDRIFSYDWELYDSRHLVFKPKLIDPDILIENFLWLEKNTFSLDSLSTDCACSVGEKSKVCEFDIEYLTANETLA